MSDNPYQSPDTSSLKESCAAASLPTLYKTDSTRFTIGEYWRSSPNLLAFILLALLKVCRIRIPGTRGLPRGDLIIFVQLKQLSEVARAALGPLQADCERAAMELAFYYTVPSGPNYTAYGALLLSPDGACVVAMAHHEFRLRDRTMYECDYGLISRSSDGRFIVTCNTPERRLVPPEIDRLAVVDRPFAEVLAEHRKRLAAKDLQVITTADLPRFLVDIQTCINDFLVRRGVLVPMSREEILDETAYQPRPGGQPVRAAGVKLDILSRVSRAAYRISVTTALLGLGFVIFFPDPRIGGQSNVLGLLLLTISIPSSMAAICAGLASRIIYGTRCPWMKWSICCFLISLVCFLVQIARLVL